MKKYDHKKMIEVSEKYNLDIPFFVLEWMRKNPNEINFCGAKGGLKVPNTMWLLDLGYAACAPHDGEFGLLKDFYVTGLRTNRIKAELNLGLGVLEANIRMLSNGLRAIWHNYYEEKKITFRLLRSLRAMWYFMAVMWRGKKSLKNSIDEVSNVRK